MRNTIDLARQDLVLAVSSDYFRTTGSRAVRGRAFTDQPVQLESIR